jgi:integrase
MRTVPRRGWREPIENGIWRMHRLGCRSSTDHKPKRRCDCPYQFKGPGAAPGTSRTVTFDGSLVEARRERAALRAAGRPASPEPVVAGGDTLREFAHFYLQVRTTDLAGHTIETTARDYRKHVDPDLGHLPVEDITRAVVKTWFAETTKRAPSRRACVGALAALRVILSYAVEVERIATNPARNLRLPPRDPHARRTVEQVLTREQLDRLVTDTVVPLAHRTMFRAAGEASLRRGEVIALTWPDAILNKRRLRVRASVEQINGVKRIKTVKSGRERYVAITDAFAEALADWYALSVIDGAGNAGGFVWPGREGEAMSHGTLTQALRRAQLLLGLVDAQSRPLVTFHGLRHTAASIMFAANVPTSTISKQLGHADSTVTTTVYEHLVHDSQLDAAAAAFDPMTAGTTVREPVRDTLA